MTGNSHQRHCCCILYRSDNDELFPDVCRRQCGDDELGHRYVWWCYHTVYGLLLCLGKQVLPASCGSPEQRLEARNQAQSTVHNRRKVRRDFQEVCRGLDCLCAIVPKCAITERLTECVHRETQ